MLTTVPSRRLPGDHGAGLRTRTVMRHQDGYVFARLLLPVGGKERIDVAIKLAGRIVGHVQNRRLRRRALNAGIRNDESGRKEHGDADPRYRLQCRHPHRSIHAGRYGRQGPLSAASGIVTGEKSGQKDRALRYRSCRRQMPSSMRTDPYPELKLVKPAKTVSRYLASLRKCRHDRQYRRPCRPLSLMMRPSKICKIPPRRCPFGAISGQDSPSAMQTRPPTEESRSLR